MPLQVTMQFVLGENGWSETHFYPSETVSTLIGDDGTLGNPLDTLLRGRLGVMPFHNYASSGATLSQNPRLVRTRVSLYPATGSPARIVRIYEPEDPGFTYGQYPPETFNGRVSDTPVETYTRLEITANLNVPGIGGGAAQPKEGHIFLGGVPDAYLIPPQEYAPSSQWNNYLNAYLETLSSAGWMTRVRASATTAADPTLPTRLIGTFQVSSDGRTAQVTPTTIAAGGLAPTGQFSVVIRGRHPSEWNGVHRGFVIAGIPPAQDTIQLGPARQPLGDWVAPLTPTPFSGTIQLLGRLYAVYVNFGVTGFDHRDDGRPFGQRVGRRKRPR